MPSLSAMLQYRSSEDTMLPGLLVIDLLSDPFWKLQSVSQRGCSLTPHRELEQPMTTCRLSVSLKLA